MLLTHMLVVYPQCFKLQKFKAHEDSHVYTLDRLASARGDGRAARSVGSCDAEGGGSSASSGPGAGEGGKSPRCRALLTEQQAVAIYSRRLNTAADGALSSRVLAWQYGVSCPPKLCRSGSDGRLWACTRGWTGALAHQRAAIGVAVWWALQAAGGAAAPPRGSGCPPELRRAESGDGALGARARRRLPGPVRGRNLKDGRGLQGEGHRSAGQASHRLCPPDCPGPIARMGPAPKIRSESSGPEDRVRVASGEAPASPDGSGAQLPGGAARRKRARGAGVDEARAAGGR